MAAKDSFDADRRLVERALDGDESAFEELFDACFPALYRFALRRVRGDESVAEEVVQRTLCIAFVKLTGWRGEAALLTWLCTICRNEIASHFRRHQALRSALELDEEAPDVRLALEILHADGNNPERNAIREQVTELVHAALDRIPSHYARALEWKYLEEASMKEIAVRLSTTAKAVESLLTRARVAYRQVLEPLLRGRAGPASEGGGDE